MIWHFCDRPHTQSRNGSYFLQNPSFSCSKHTVTCLEVFEIGDILPIQWDVVCDVIKDNGYKRIAMCQSVLFFDSNVVQNHPSVIRLWQWISICMISLFSFMVVLKKLSLLLKQCHSISRDYCILKTLFVPKVF